MASTSSQSNDEAQQAAHEVEQDVRVPSSEDEDFTSRTKKKRAPIPFIKMQDLPQSRFPTEYFAYVYEHSKSCNPYCLSKLRMSTNIGRCRFLSSDTKESIIKEIERFETKCFVTMQNFNKYIIIIRLEDISQVYSEDVGFQETKYHYKDESRSQNGGFYNFADTFMESAKSKDISELKKVYAAFKITTNSKCYRANYLAIAIPRIYSSTYYNATMADPVSKLMCELVLKNTSVLSTVYDDITPFDNILQQDLEFIFQNILAPKINKAWYHYADCNHEISNYGDDSSSHNYHHYKGKYTYQYYTNGNTEFLENGEDNYYMSTQLLFTNKPITNFKTRDFYPFRIKAKMLMNMETKEFSKDLFDGTFLNVNRKEITKSTRLCSLILQCGDLNPDYYRIELYNISYICIKFSESFLQKFITGSDYMNGGIIKYIFPCNDLEFIKFPGYIDFFTKLKEEHALVKNKFKSTIHNGLDDKIIGFDKLFTYQRRNISWMGHIEKDIRNGKLYLTTNYKYKVYPARQKLFKYIINGDQYVNMKYPYRFDSYSNSSDIYNAPPGFQTVKDFKAESAGRLLIKGGIIADDIGLGKTASTICHIVNQLETDKQHANTFDGNNLIILPPRLMKQWETEIAKFVKTPINILVLNTIRDVKNNAQDDLKNYGIVLLCRSLLFNTNYMELRDELGDSHSYINIYRAKWNRIILDEAHESLSCSMHHGSMYHFKLSSYVDIYDTIKKSDDLSEQIIKLKSNYRWCLTATPYCHGINSMVGILQFLLEPDGWDSSLSPDSVNASNYSGIIKTLIAKKYDDLSRSEKTIVSDDKLASFKTLDKYYQNTYNKYLPYLAIDPKIIIQCLSLITRQTLKSEVRDEINIPDFIEKRIFIDFTSLERKIYNIIAGIDGIVYDDNDNSVNLNNFSDQPSTPEQLTSNGISQGYQRHIRLVYQLCTNLLIKDYFSWEYDQMLANIKDSSDDLSKSENISLDMLQSFMISKFTTLIEKNKDNLAELQIKWDAGGKYVSKLRQLYSALVKYFHYDYKNASIVTYSSKLAYNTQLQQVAKDVFHHNYCENFGILYEYFIDLLLKHLEDINANIDTMQILMSDESILEFMEKNRYPKNPGGMLSDIKMTQTPYYDILRGYDKLIETCTHSIDAIMLYAMGCIYNFLKLQGPEDIESSITRATANIETYTRQLSLFSNEFITEQTQEPCMICYDTLDKIVVTQCRHIFCEGCYRVFLERSGASKQFPCPACRSTIAVDTITRSRVHRPTNEDGSTNDPTLYHKRVVINGIVMKPAWKMDCINRFGSKMSVLLEYLGELLEISENRIILFSQYDNMLKLIGQVLDNYGIQHVYCKGSVFAVTKAITNFKKNDKIRIIMLSSETANSGNNLTEANHVIFIDVINQSPEATVEIEKQAIGRTVRLGQNKGVTVSRFIMRNTVEELQYNAIKYDMASAN